MFPVRIYYESAAYGSAISHRRSSVRARAPGLASPPRPVAEPLSTRIGPHLICSPGPLGSRRNFVQSAHPGSIWHRGFEPAAARFMMRDLTGMP